MAITHIHPMVSVFTEQKKSSLNKSSRSWVCYYSLIQLDSRVSITAFQLNLTDDPRRIYGISPAFIISSILRIQHFNLLASSGLVISWVVTPFVSVCFVADMCALYRKIKSRQPKFS